MTSPRNDTPPASSLPRSDFSSSFHDRHPWPLDIREQEGGPPGSSGNPASYRHCERSEQDCHIVPYGPHSCSRTCSVNCARRWSVRATGSPCAVSRHVSRACGRCASAARDALPSSRAVHALQCIHPGGGSAVRRGRYGKSAIPSEIFRATRRQWQTCRSSPEGRAPAPGS